MTREQQEQFEQDSHGNVRRKLDTLRGRQGQVDADPPEGFVEILSGETDTALAIFSNPTHADELIVIEVWGFNSGPSGTNTFHLVEGDPDGAGGINNPVRRSVDIVVDSETTRREEFAGEAFTNAIGVVSEFAGQVAVGVISDHHESSEPESEQATA